MGSDRVRLTKLADQRVFVAGVAIGTAAPGTTRGGSLNGLSDGAVRRTRHGTKLIKVDKLRSTLRETVRHRSSPRRDGASFPAARGGRRGSASILSLKSANR